jgi:hypothetical protein
MRTTGSWVVAFVLIVGVPAWAKGNKASPKAKPDVVSLAFGWPDGLNADVTYRWTRSKPGKPDQALAMTARLTVARQGEAVRVAFRDWKAQPTANASPGAAAPSLEAITTVVDTKGTFVRVDGTISADDSTRVAAGVARARERESGANQGSGATKKTAEMIPALSRVQAERTWQMLVGSWTDVALEIGEDLETDVERRMPSVPGLPGGTLKTKLRFRAERRLDCPDDPSKRCVELKTRSEADRDSMAKLLEKMGIQAGAKDAVTASDLTAVEEIELVTEPDRLIPHRLNITKVVGRREGGQPAQLDRTTWTFRYAVPPGAPPSK